MKHWEYVILRKPPQSSWRTACYLGHPSRTDCVHWGHSPFLLSRWNDLVEGWQLLMALISKERKAKTEPHSLGGWGGRSGRSRWGPSTAGSRGSRRAAGSTGGPGSWGARRASSSRCPPGWNCSGWSRAAGWGSRCCTRSSGPGSPGPRRRWSAKWEMWKHEAICIPSEDARDAAKIEHQVPSTYLPHSGEREQEVFAGCSVGLGGGPLYK